MQKNVWVIVADEAVARILRKPSGLGALEEVQTLTDPAAHAKGADFRTDAEGRRAGGVPAGGTGAGASSQARPATATASAGESRQHVEAELFAKRVAQTLQQAAQAGSFDELHVAAAPRFLGLLRQCWSNEVSRRIVREFDKDWVKANDSDLRERLFPVPAQR